MQSEYGIIDVNLGRIPECPGRLQGRSQALSPGGTMLRGRKKVMTDGLYAEGKEAVAGYFLLQAAGLAEASEAAKGCPILEIDGSVEVRPIRNDDISAIACKH